MGDVVWKWSEDAGEQVQAIVRRRAVACRIPDGIAVASQWLLLSVRANYVVFERECLRCGGDSVIA